MSTVYLYNGFGQYENRKGVKGITLTYGGTEFWLPYDQITPIPDFTFREFDHEHTAEEWEQGNDTAMVYRALRVPGARVAEELTEVQQPVKNREKGIVILSVHRDRLTDKLIKVPAGTSEEGIPLFEEVRTLQPHPDEILAAKTLALEYKKLIIEEYFQSKRERMSGGQGRIYPVGLTKVFMQELGVQDIDVLTQQQPKQAAASVSPEVAQEFLLLLRQALMGGTPPDQAIVDTANKVNKATGANKKPADADLVGLT